MLYNFIKPENSTTLRLTRERMRPLKRCLPDRRALDAAIEKPFTWPAGVRMYCCKTVISFKEQAKRRLAALLSGNKNKSPLLLKNRVGCVLRQILIPSWKHAHLTCFADCSFQWNKDFATIYTANIDWITLLNLLCGIMPARDYCGSAGRNCIDCAARTRKLKRRLADWRALK